MEFHDSWFFIGIFVFIFLIWIAIGGPTHPIAFTGPSLAEPDVLGGGTYLSFPRARYGIGSSDVSLPGSSTGGGSLSNGPETSAPAPVGGIAFGEASPYRRIVSMSHSISNAGSSDPKNESIEIRITQDAEVPVDLSGWVLQSSVTGNTVAIPKGTEIPTSGTVNAEQDIVLTAGQRAIINTGQSPIGASFRENKCIGYFSTFQKFSPALPQNCPLPADELTSLYGPYYIRDARCIDFVNKLSRCQVTLTPPAGATSACQSFVTKYLNYNGCLSAHQSDTDLNGNTWRVYLGRSTSMWRTRHEVVKLLDKTGKTVDAFSY
ncbi:MAG: hypothetical protein WCW36_00515 [Candidatus Paceibacterota bacterium]|jgi:hypothetical protein